VQICLWLVRGLLRKSVGVGPGVSWSCEVRCERVGLPNSFSRRHPDVVALACVDI